MRDHRQAPRLPDRATRSGFDGDGRILGVDFMLAVALRRARPTCRGPVDDRAVCHADNAYFLPARADRLAPLQDQHRVEHRLPRLRRPAGDGRRSSTCIDEIARALDLDPVAVRRRNFYGARARDVTPYDMTVEDFIVDRARSTSSRRRPTTPRGARRSRAWNAASPVVKRGIAMTPVKFGISFTATLSTRPARWCTSTPTAACCSTTAAPRWGRACSPRSRRSSRDEFGIDLDQVQRLGDRHGARCRTRRRPRPPRGSDLNGMAAQAAARADQGAHRPRSRPSTSASRRMQSAFAANRVDVGDAKRCRSPSSPSSPYCARVSLSASGFYKTPKIH